VTVRAVQRLGRGQVKAGLRPRTGQVPADAITNKDGDPGFRLVDTQGDGYLDLIYSYKNKEQTTINNTRVPIGIGGGCIPTTTPGTFTSKAFAFNKTRRVNESSEYAPPIPFVTQYDLNNATRIDLFVKL
jgi:hypothetical protein